MADLGAVGGIEVHGLANLNRVLRRTERDVRLGIRKEIREFAKPVQADAERLAQGGIRNIGKKWWKMRVGITTNVVYVAPRQRGSKTRTPRNRPTLATLMSERAMQPALERNAPNLEARFNEMLDRVAFKFNHTGG